MDAKPLYELIYSMQNIAPETLRQCVELIEARIAKDGRVEAFLLSGIIVQITNNAKWQEFGEVYKYVMSMRVVLEDNELIRLQNLSAVLDVCAFLIRAWERVCQSLQAKDVYVEFFSYLREEYRVLLMVVNAGLFKSSKPYKLLYKHAFSQIYSGVRDWRVCKNRFRRCFHSLVEQNVISQLEMGEFEKGFKRYAWLMHTLIRDLNISAQIQA